jgi:NADPH-dependent 2,4-dienoyl-CoA reductase/sulfur reductase-like enzyme
MMNNNLTTKFMEGLQAAQKAAQSAGRAQIYPAELLLALVQQEGGVLSAVLTRAGVDSARLQRELEQQLERQPRQRGGVAQRPGIGPELDRVLNAAEQQRKAMGDDFLSVEHFVLGVFEADGTLSPILENCGLSKAKYLEALGISCINVSCGTYDSGATIIEPNYFQEGWKINLASNIRKAVKIPVIAVCNVKHPAFAELMLEEGDVDFVGIARGHLADPNWGRKARAGQDVMIRKCIGCMECFRILNDGLPLGCTLNPILGREFEYGDEKLVKNGEGRPVAVIGGGPAGMEAALTLAKRGFNAILFEAKEKLGGTVNLAAVPPNKQMLNEFIETMQAQLVEEGVDIRLGVNADLETVKATGAEAVFMAAGGKPILPEIPGIGNAVIAEDVLSGAAPVENQTLVVIGGGVTGLETAEYLVPRNKVTVVEMTDKIGGNLYPSIVMHLATEIVKNGGTIAKGYKLTAIEEGQVRVTEVATGEEKCLPADTVVLAMGVRSNRPEIEEFRAEYGDKLIMVGDSSRPGQIYDALHSGHDRAFVYDT